MTDGGDIEYKYIMKNDSNETVWEDGENRKVSLTGWKG